MYEYSMANKPGRYKYAVTVYLFLLLVSLYSLTISTSLASRNSGEGFMRINELEIFLQTGSIGWYDTDKWGTTGRGGRKYNWHQFGHQMFVMPFYLFMRGGAYAFFLVNIISTALTALLVMHILLLLGFNLRSSALTAITFGVATLSWFYAAKTPHEHALAIVFVMGGVYYAIRYRTGLGHRNLYLCMASVGLGFTVRYDVILCLLPIAVYFFQGRRDAPEEKFSLLETALISAAVLSPFFLANFTYNYVRFGNIFETGYAGSTGAPDKLFGLEFLPRGLIGTFLSPGRSVFLFSPVLLLFPFFLRGFRRRVEKTFFMLFLLMPSMYVIFYCLHHSWDGDWCFGPRYFLILNPFMLMPLAVMFEGFRGKGLLKKGVIVAVIVLSVLVQVAFVSSNSNLSNMIKYGVDDDSRPDLTRKYTRSFGLHGSWEWLGGYFKPEYSQFLNQLKIFYYLALINIDEEYIFDIKRKIESSDAPYLTMYMGLEFDLWWQQNRSRVEDWVAIIPAVLGLLSLFQTVRVSGKARGETPQNG
jgi:hypothetical protein